MRIRSRSPTQQDRIAFLKAYHLFSTLGPVHILTSVLVRFLPMLSSPIKNMRLSKDRYGHRVPLTKASPPIDPENWSYLSSASTILPTYL